MGLRKCMYSSQVQLRIDRGNDVDKIVNWLLVLCLKCGLYLENRERKKTDDKILLKWKY